MNGYLALDARPARIIHEGYPNENQRRHRKCNAVGFDCNNRAISDVINNARVRSLYCEYHHCHMVENGTMCRVAKPVPNARYCNERGFCRLVLFIRREDRC